MSSADVRRLRLAAAAPVPADPAPPGAPAFVGKVTTANAPPGTFMVVNPVSVLGTESEGGTGTLNPDAASPVVVLHLGPKPAVRDDLVVCRLVPYRWVSESSTTNAGMYRVCPQVLKCDGSAPPAGSTVTVTDGLGFSATCTLAAIRCCVTVPGPGTYTVTYDPDGTTQSVTVVAGVYATFLNFCVGGLGSIKGQVFPSDRTCATGLRIPTLVTAKRGGTVVGSGTTDATGHFQFCYGGTAGTDLTVGVDTPPPRMAPASITIPGGSSSGLDLCTTNHTPVRIVLPAASGYAYAPCFCLEPGSGGLECQTPLDENLTLTTPDGPVVLTALATGGTGEGVWVGNRSVTTHYGSYDPCLGCAPATVDAYFQFGGSVPFGPGFGRVGCTLYIFIDRTVFNCPNPVTCWGGSDPSSGRGGGAEGSCTSSGWPSNNELCTVDSCAPGFLYTMTGGHDVWGAGAVFTMPLTE